MMPADAEGNFSGKHLVVLGCGYVGARVADEALARGMRVTALTRNAAKAELLRARGIATVVADLAEAGWHAHPQLATPADFVLNSVSSGGAGLEGYARSYVGGMESLVTWACAHPEIATIVYTSSTSVYPQGGGVVVDEKASTAGEMRAAGDVGDATEAGAANNVRDRPQLLAEAETLLRGASAFAARRFILRLAGIYGPGRTHLVAQVRAGEIAGVGSHRLNLAHRDDIAAAILACFAAPKEIVGGTFNVADDAPTPKAEVAAWIAEQLGLPAPRFTGEPAGGRRSVTPDRVIANAALKRALGWRPRFPSFREGYAAILSR